MGGKGSGYRHDTKRLVEDQTRISISQYKRMLFDGNFFEINLWEGSGLEWPAAIKVTNSDVYITYQIYNSSKKLELITNRIQLDATNIHWGTRMYFLCPNCGRRIRHIYLEERSLACRRCSRLGYLSQRKGYSREFNSEA